MESAVTEEKKKDVNYKIQTVYKDLELPVLQPNIDAAHAYLFGIFGSGKPIFGVVSDSVQKTPEATAMESIIYENSTTTGWGRQISLFLKNGLKYNIGAINVDWWIRRTFNPITDTSKSLTSAQIQEAYRGGNELRNYDMYNTFFDTSKAPGDMSASGDFVGCIERLTLVQLYSFIQTLQVNGGKVMNVDQKLWQSSAFRNQHWVPQIVSKNMVNAGTNWMAFLSSTLSPLRYNTVQGYEVVHYYRRIIPSMLEIDCPDKNSVQIWYFVEVNGIVIFAERKSNAHNNLPTVFTQPIEDSLGLQAKGLGENLLNFQNLSGAMFRARMADLARLISDRGIFDPSVISSKDINSTNPAAKIPVRPTAYGKDIRTAYHAIPYDGKAGTSLYQDIGQVMKWGSNAAHVNPAQRGEFTKGNRTLGEFDNVMENADASQQTMAMLIEDQAFVPMKNQIKINILQYQSATSLPDPNTQKVVEINPALLRQSIINFKIADGLVSKDKLLSIPQQLQFYQVMAQDPQGSVEYDLTGMMANVMETKGVRTAQFKRTPEQVAAIRQQQQAQVTGGAPKPATA